MNYKVLIISLLCYHFTFAQILVKTTTEESYDDLIISTGNPLESESYSIPVTFEERKKIVNRFYLDDLKSLKSYFEYKKFDESKFKNWLIDEGFKSDSIFLNEISNFIDVLAIKKSDKSVILIVDTNRDKVFDEMPFFVNGDFSNKCTDFKALPKVSFNLELYDKNGSKKTVHHEIRLNPFNAGSNFNKELANEIPLSVVTNSVKNATVFYEDTKYDFIIKGNSYSPYYLKDRTEFLVFKDDSATLKTKESRAYKVGDFIWNTDLYISAISEFGDFLILDEKPNKERFGTNVNERIDDKIMSLLTQEKKYLLLNFWGTWCKPCLEEIPSLVNIYNQLDTAKVNFISISTQSQLNQINNIFNKKGVKWPNLQNENLAIDVASSLRINSFPTTLLISPENIILEMSSGIIDEQPYLEMLKNNSLLK